MNDAASTTILFCAGLVLAVVFALAALAFVPEQPMVEPPMKVAQPVNFDVLNRGANIADLERAAATTLSSASPVTARPAADTENGAYRMTPRPADLTGERTRGRGDEQLRAAIGKGIPGTAMRGWDDRLSDTQLRQVLGYVRHLGRVESTRTAP